MYSSAPRASVFSVLRTMNAPLLPEVLTGVQRADEPALPLATEGVQRYVWQSAFGPMLIEVRDGIAFVNGQEVVPFADLRGKSSGG
jgi:hypothetical protein